jgi:hypothetical protein
MDRVIERHSVHDQYSDIEQIAKLGPAEERAKSVNEQVASGFGGDLAIANEPIPP